MSKQKNKIDANAIATEELTAIFVEVYKEIWEWLAKQRDPPAIAAQKYAGQIWERYNSIRVFGMSEDVPLDTLFVRINILEKIQATYRDSAQFLEENFDRDARKIKFGSKRTTKTGIGTINAIDKMIVLGKPGAGKTTYLKFLALQSVKKKTAIKKRKIPVFLSLKELADKNQSLLQFIAYQFDICALPDADLFIENLLQKGRCLILLDGLDEVQEERKDAIIQEVIDFSAKYSGNQFVVSCRVAAYNAWFQKFIDVEIADFNNRQIKTFITKWFQKEPEIGKECWEKLKKEKPLKEMAATPLLLTLLCIAYDENLEFQTNRAELYEEAIDALLKRWDRTRRIKRFEPYKNLSLGRKRTMLGQIAVKTFREGKYFLKKRELVKLISEYIRNIQTFELEELKETSENILEAIVANHGIFVLRAKGVYSFAHLTFQEYFTARYIAVNASGDSRNSLIEEHITDDKWREVFLLTTAMLGEADLFLLRIHQQANKILENNIALQKLLKDVESLLLRNENPYPLFLRKVGGLFLALDFDYGLAHDFARALDNTHIRALDSTITRARAPCPFTYPFSCPCLCP